MNFQQHKVSDKMQARPKGPMEKIPKQKSGNKSPDVDKYSWPDRQLLYLSIISFRDLYSTYSGLLPDREKIELVSKIANYWPYVESYTLILIIIFFESEILWYSTKSFGKSFWLNNLVCKSLMVMDDTWKKAGIKDAFATLKIYP